MRSRPWLLRFLSYHSVSAVESGNRFGSATTHIQTHLFLWIKPSDPPNFVFYSGKPQLCRSFLAKCSLYISLQPSSFPTEQSKVAFVITLLSGRAASWGYSGCRSRGFLAAIHSSNFLRNSRKCLIALPLAEKQRDFSQSCVKGKRHRNRLLY